MRQQSSDALWRAVGQTIDILAVASVSIGLVLFALSEELIPRLFGVEFEPAAPAFAILALSVPATYFTMIIGSAFVADERGWQNTRVNFYTMLLVVFGVIVWLVVAPMSLPGAAAEASALVIVVGEWITVVLLVWLRPFTGLTRRTTFRLALLLGVAGLAIAGRESNSVGLRYFAAGITALIAFGELPRLVRSGRTLLQASR